MPTWTTPRTWVAGDVVLASELNVDVRDNMNYLLAPNSANTQLDLASDSTTTSTSFADVPNMVVTATPQGTILMCGVMATMVVATGPLHLNLSVNGTDVAADDGIMAIDGGINARPVCFVYLLTGLSAGVSALVRLRWKVDAGTATFYRGAGTAGFDVHPQMWLRER